MNSYNIVAQEQLCGFMSLPLLILKNKTILDKIEFFGKEWILCQPKKKTTIQAQTSISPTINIRLRYWHKSSSKQLLS